MTLESHRGHLFAVAYRMLGTVADAEDVVQDTWVRWLRRANDNDNDNDAKNNSDVKSQRSFLTTTAARLSLDRLRSLKRDRERYDGMWLPEPVVGVNPDEQAARTESLSPAFLVVLETLAPIERAAFVLRDIFELDYEDIATVVEKSVTNCRQICKRARDRVGETPRFSATSAQADRLAALFFTAASLGDLDALVALFREDIVAWSDHGGKASAARNTIVGPKNVAKYLIGTTAKFAVGKRPVFARVNGAPGAILYDGDAVHSVIFIEVDGDKIVRFGTIRNPDKLQRVATATLRSQV